MQVSPQTPLPLQCYFCEFAIYIKIVSQCVKYKRIPGLSIIFTEFSSDY